ncbi:MAG: hypothetical protein AB8G26_14640, partial [Ilumatobacter sp.]
MGDVIRRVSSRGRLGARLALIGLVAAGITVSSMPTAADAVDETVALIVADDAALLNGETATVARIESTDRTVTVVADEDASSATLTADLVIVGSSVSSSALDDAVFDLEVPMIIAKPWLFDDAGIAPPSR